MKERFINFSLDFITKYQECDDLKILKLKYGLEGIYSLLLKLSVVIIISILFSTIKETLFFLLFYATIRTFSFGIHAKSNVACWITTILIYNIIPLLTKKFIIPKYYGYIILSFAFISMLLWSPADTPKRPLIRKKNRIKNKIISCLIIIIYFLIYNFNNFNLINNALLYALITQSICINPIIYKITNTQFNNYKYYHKKINTV